MITAETLRKSLESNLEGTSEPIQAHNAIGALRSKVESLRAKQTRADTDAEAEAAARELVKASEDLRLAEIMLPRREAAASAAAVKRSQAGASALRSIASHYEALSNEAHDLALAILRAMTSPQAAAIRADQERMGVVRDQSITNMAGFAIGCFDAWRLRDAANQGGAFGNGEAAVGNAYSLIDSFDEDTAAILAQIDHLKSILAAVGGAKKPGEGIQDSPSSGETAEAA